MGSGGRKEGIAYLEELIVTSTEPHLGMTSEAIEARMTILPISCVEINETFNSDKYCLNVYFLSLFQNLTMHIL